MKSIFKRFSKTVKNSASLFKAIKKTGYITEEDVEIALKKGIIKDDDIDRLTQFTEEHGIKIVDEESDDDKDNIEEQGAVGIYLKQVGTIKRLSNEDEMAHWKRLDDIKEELKKIEEQLSKKKIRQKTYDRKLKKLNEEFEFCQNKLVKSNLCLVISIAKKYFNSCVPFIDLIDEGNIGLIEAVRRFDYKKGFKFSTYGSWWIKQSITKALSTKSHLIRFPMHITRMKRNYAQSTKDLSQKFGRAPTLKEVADDLGVTLKQLSSVLVFSMDPTSIETPLGPGAEHDLSVFIEDKKGASPDKTVLMESLKTTIGDVLSELTEKERKIINMRFGLDGSKIKTLEETGNAVGLTRERVRQIQERTLKKIRSLNLSDELKNYLCD